MKHYGAIPESSYGLPMGMYWLSYHSDGSNGTLREEAVARWVRRKFGEGELVDPGEWRNFAAGDRNPKLIPGGMDPLRDERRLREALRSYTK